MTNYELKPDNVQAVLFTGTNWFQVEELLGPHLAKERKFPTTIERQVFDVAEMIWMDVVSNYYVIKYPDNAVSVMSKDEFEDRYQPQTYKQQPNWFPSIQPGVIGTNSNTWGGPSVSF